MARRQFAKHSILSDEALIDALAYRLHKYGLDSLVAI